MKVIGLCGGSGSGKGRVSDFFAQLGLPSVDTDRVYHDMISKNSQCTRDLISAFGETVYSDPGIDRKALASIVFSDREKLRLLNEIAHSHILSKVRDIIADSQDSLGIIIDAPLLFESGFDAECDVTVCVVADEDVRVERIIKRDHITREQAMARIASQIPSDELRRRCDYTIENNSTEKELEKAVRALAQTILNN